MSTQPEALRLADILQHKLPSIECLEVAAAELRRLHGEVEALRAELETERMRLAACSVAALGYFEGCADEYSSASLDDVLRLHAEVDALRADAERYRWLISRRGLELRSEKQPNFWQRVDGTTFSSTHYLAEGGTQHAPNDSLDAVIDGAMLVARERDSGTFAARGEK